MSKFSVLKVEGLSSSSGEDSDTNNRSKKNSGNFASGKSKKKKQQQQGHPVPAARSHKPSQQQQQQQQPQQQSKKKQQTTEAVAAKQDSALEEWQRKDQELVETNYQRELAQAIMASRLEQQAQATSAPSAAAGSMSSSGVPGSTLARMEAESRRAADAALRREKLSEKELIRHEVEQELLAKFQAALAEKDAEAVALRSEADNSKRALAAAEAQVAHLNSLLSLVEGKKAKGLSEQIYQLTAVITELTDSTKALDSELAKEKTRCHQLQEQVDRLRSSAAR